MTKNPPKSISRYLQQYEQVKDVFWLPCDEIVSSPINPRKVFDPGKLGELADNIKEHGVLQNIIVRPLKGREHEGKRFELVAGERRWRATQKAGISHIPARIVIVSDYEALRIALSENIKQESLTDGEEALGITSMFKYAAADGWTLSKHQAARDLGVSVTFISNRLKIDPEKLEKDGYSDLAEMVLSERNVISSVTTLKDSPLDFEEREPIVAAIKDPKQPTSFKKVVAMVESAVAEKKNKAESSRTHAHTRQHVNRRQQMQREAEAEASRHLSSVTAGLNSLRANLEHVSPEWKAKNRRRLDLIKNQVDKL
jgi:ParB/RepB/Spo0J family partition protein